MRRTVSGILCCSLVLVYSSARGQLSGQLHLMWYRSYMGSENLPERAQSVAVDDEGNIYVTGNGCVDSTGSDYVTIKYAPNGTEEWVRLYDGTKNADDFGQAIALDSQGNPCVTGSSWELNRHTDITTIKYDAEGNESWVAYYNGAAGSYDYPSAIAVDMYDNVYVTGKTMDSYGEDDYVTVKYDANGVEQWAVIYNSDWNFNDYAVDIAVDHTGNVYVTGASQAPSDWNYLTIKYDANGGELWTAQYDPGDIPVAIEVDEVGNAYVTGSFSGQHDEEACATLKYDTKGNEQWVAVFDLQDYYRDVRPRDLGVDSSGNVYVTGGAEFFPFVSQMDFFTVKYDTAGDQVWLRSHDNVGDFDIATSMAIDNFGFIYVTGYSDTDPGGDVTRDCVTIKYSPSGRELWRGSYDRGEGGDDSANAIATDMTGNVIVVGESENLSSDVDFCTIKYAPPAAHRVTIEKQNFPERHIR